MHWVLDGVLRCVRVRVPMRAINACRCERMCAGLCISIGLHLRACVFDVCVRRRCARTLVARRRLAVFIARPGAARCGRARVAAFWTTGRARARRPQVSPGPAARTRRRGLHDGATRL